MNAAVVEQARALQAEGLTLRAIAERLNISHTQVARLLRSPVTMPAATPAQAGDAGFLAGLLGNAAEPADDSSDDEPDEPAPDDATDELAWLRGMQRRAMARADRFERAGDYTASQRAARDAAVLAPVIMRAAREKSQHDGTLCVKSIDEIKAACAALDARAAKVEEQGLRCVECGRAQRRREAEK